MASTPHDLLASRCTTFIGSRHVSGIADPIDSARLDMHTLNTENPSPMERATLCLRPSEKMFAVCGIWLLALGIYFLFMRPALLPEDLRYIGSSLDTIRSSVPGLERWLGHVFDVMGGFMVATGAMTMFVAWRLPEIRERGSLTALSVAGAAGVALMSATNFALSSNYRWLLLAPALLWFAGLLCYLRERAAQSANERPVGVG